jgi:hypothetical protein
METDLEGNVIWEKTFDGGYAIANPRDLLIFENGDFLISYLTCESSGLCTPDNFQTAAITKFDKNGDELWTKDIIVFEDIYEHGHPVMEVFENGGAAISFYRMNFEEGWWYPPVLIWVDADGNVVNQYDFPPDTERYVRDLQKTSTGDIVGVGYVDMLELGLGGWVFAMSQEGELLWSRDINDLRFPGKYGRFNAVQESENGGLIITGFILDTVENKPLASVSNVWLVKLDSMGCLEHGCGDVQIVSGSAVTQASNKPALFKIYPNPVNGNKCFLERNLTNGAAGKVDIEILDCFGRLVWKKYDSADPLIQLETAGLQHGIYLVRVEDWEGRTLQVEKLIIP